MDLIWSKSDLTFAVNGGICFFESQGEFSLIIPSPVAKLARNLLPRGKKKKSKPERETSVWFSHTIEKNNVFQH